MAVVFDCSVTLAWFLKDERTAFTDAAFELLESAECWVPYLWRLEFPNALLMAERRRRVGREQRLEAVTQHRLRATDALEQRAALVERQLQRFIEQGFEPWPA